MVQPALLRRRKLRGSRRSGRGRRRRDPEKPRHVALERLRVRSARGRKVLPGGALDNGGRASEVSARRGVGECQQGGEGAEGRGVLCGFDQNCFFGLNNQIFVFLCKIISKIFKYLY